MAEVTDTGIVGKTATEYISEIQDAWKTIFGDNLNLEVDTPQGQITNLLGLIANACDQAIVDVGRSLDITQAQGQQLGDLASILGIYRRGATKSNVSATMHGSINVSVPAGSKARTDAGDIFVLDTAVILEDNGANGGIGTGFFVAEEDGPIPCSAGELYIIATPSAGWDTLSNVNDGALGSLEETDAQYRRRYFNELGVNSVSQMQSIISGVQTIDDVLTATGAENDTQDFITVAGVQVPPHGFVVVVDGGSSEEVASQIRKHKGGGACSLNLVECTMEGIALAVINKGIKAQVLAADNPLGIDLDFYLRSDIQLNASGIGKGWFVCETEGDISFDAGTLSNLPVIVEFLNTVSNDYPQRFVHQYVNAYGPDGVSVIQEVPINFKRVVSVAASVFVNLTPEPNFPIDGYDQITNNLVAYFEGSDNFSDNFELDGLQIGETVYTSRLYTPVNMVQGHTITEIRIEVDGVDQGTSLDILLDEIATLSAEDVNFE